MRSPLPLFALVLAAGSLFAQTPAATPSPVASESAPPPGVNSATYPLPRGGKDATGWLAAHEKLVASVKNPGAQVLFIGDSITQFWLSPDKGAPVWKEKIAPLRAANIGIAGDRTEHILWRLRNGGLGAADPRVIVLLAGINNINKNTAPEIVEGDTAIVNEIRAQRPDAQILLLGVLPIGLKPNPQREKIKEINSALAKLADDKSVFFLDIGAAFLTPDGILPAETFPDGLHPSTQGYVIFADAIVPRLKELLATPAR